MTSMFFTDSRDRMTASQRLRIERRMARDAAMGTIARHGTTRDEQGRPVANYTMENGGMKEAPGAGKIHLHFHGSTGDEFGEGPATPSVTSGREPAMPNGNPLDDVMEQLNDLNVAVATLATAGGYDPGSDDPDDDDVNQPDANGGVTYQSSGVGQSPDDRDNANTPDAVGGRTLYGPRKEASGYSIETSDELPDIADINAKNRKFWANTTSQSVTGMGDVPIGGQGTPGKTDSGIDMQRRLSTGEKRLDPGRTSANSLKAFGTTSDANMRRILKIEDRAYANKVLMQHTNKAIAAQQRANEKLR